MDCAGFIPRQWRALVIFTPPTPLTAPAQLPEAAAERLANALWHAFYSRPTCIKADWVKIIATELKAVLADVALCDQLCKVLSGYCGERGTSEGAVETLERCLRERDIAHANLAALRGETDA